MSRPLPRDVLSPILIAALLVTFATSAALVSRPTAARATGYTYAPWRFAGIGPSQRTLRLLVERGPCFAEATQNLDQGATEVRIAFLVGPTPLDGCPSPIYESVTIKLLAPLAGRALVGAQPRRASPPAPGAPVPRVVGLSTGDAITVLRAAGYRPQLIRRRDAPGLRRVLAQAGTRIVVSSSERRRRAGGGGTPRDQP